jgi:tRNA(Ile)-lysidine synthase
VSPSGPVDDDCPEGEFSRALWLPPGWQALNVAVALSGGADSMALLRQLLQLKRDQGGAGKLLALHINHQLRGTESDEDAQWCLQQCRQLQVPLQVQCVDTAAEAAGDGIEAAARAARYRLLTQAAQQAGARYLATAHTRDDQVETVLFRIFRGTGLRGLSGIPQTRPLSPALTLIRPLLACSRTMVLGYLAQLGQAYRTDGSNTDREFARNRLRHDLLPQLRDQYNPEIDSALVRLAAQAAAAQHAIAPQAQQLLEESQLSAEQGTLAFDLAKFSGQAQPLVCEALRIAWREAGWAQQAMTYQWWSTLSELALAPDAQAVLNLPGQVQASIAGGRLVLRG